MNNKDQTTRAIEITKRWTEVILRIGMYIALTLTLAAFIIFIATGKGYNDGRSITPSQLPQALAGFDPFAIASLAILILFISSFLPVLITTISAIITRDNKLIAITASILFFLSILLVFVFVRF